MKFDRLFRRFSSPARARVAKRRRRRALTSERLEDRRLFVAEGAVFQLSQAIDAAGLVGTLSSTVRWGDGSETAGTVTALPPSGPLRIRIDYSLDAGTSRFFDTQAKRDLLQLAADTLTTRLNDDLAAILPSGSNTWTAVFSNPANGQTATRDNLQIAANEIVVFAAGQNLPGSTRGLGGPGGFGASGTQAWLDTVRARGEAGALTNPQTDFGPWGGSVAFDLSDTTWYFGTDPNGIQSGEVDFLSVATHELAHVLGFGFLPPRPTPVSSWEALTSSGTTFRGAKAVASHGASVPLEPGDRGHWQEGILSAGRPTLMDPRISTGRRTLMAPLDYAALDDIGWDVDATRVTVTASHVFADNGTYPAEVVLRGGATGEIVTTVPVNVTSVAPQLSVVAAQTVVQGQTLSLTNIGQISDPGFRNTLATPPTNETFTYSIDWGDQTTPSTGTATIDRIGSASQTTLASFDASHLYQSLGNYTVRVSVRDDDGATDEATFAVAVVPPPVLSLVSNRTSVAEDAGADAAILTITRSGPVSSEPLTITLASDDPSEATVPASVILAAGQTSVTTSVRAIDDALLDGEQTARLTASAPGATSASVDLRVTDRERLSAAFNVATVREDAAAQSLTLTVARSNTDVGEPLEVLVSGGAASQLLVASPVVIPAGQRTVVVPLTPVNDTVAEAPANLVYSFTASGYSGTTASVAIVDDELPEFQNPDNRFDVDNSGTVTAGDALLVINALNTRGDNLLLDPAVEDPLGIFVDVTGDYRVSALDALEVINRLNLQQLEMASSGEAEPFVGPVAWQPEVYDKAMLSLFEEDELHRLARGRLF